ncbi:glycoside hydrolase family 10 [Opitutaceae bacterium TAV5]|nr:glycoside hydrolase family 10 [Opitutaceae bacterium TAV5]
MNLRTLAFLCAVQAGIVSAVPVALPAAAQPSPALTIGTGRLTEIWPAGETVRWRLTLAAAAGEPLRGARIVWTINTWNRQGVAHGEIPVSSARPGKGEIVMDFDYKPSALGWHEAVLELRDAAGTGLDRQARRFSVGSAPRSTGEYFRYGLCSHMRRQIGTPFFEKEVELSRQLGIDIIRTELAGWETTQPREGEWNFSVADTVLDALARHGIEIQPVFGYSTRWASTGDPQAKDWNEWNKTAPRLEPWLNYVRTVVERYGDRVRYWEIWNEPDISFWRAPTEAYVELFDRTSALIKKTSSRALVLNGGLAMVRRPPNPDFVTRFLASASPGNWDIFAYHDYHTFAQLLQRREEVGALLPRLKVKLPVWVNEGGSHTLLAGGEREQARRLVKKISTAPSLGIGAYFWYNLRDDGLDPGEPEHHFGLTLHDGQPKPAWSAFQALIRELGAARYLRSLPESGLPAGAWAHLYRLPADGSASPARHTLVLWREGASRQTPVWLDAGAGARITAVTDLMGNPIKVAAGSGGVAFPVTDDPVYVHIEGEGEPALSVRPLLEAPSPVVLVAGEPSRIAVTLHNPLPHPVTAEMAWSSPIAGLHFPERQSRLALPAHGSAVTTVELHAAADRPVSTDTIREAEANEIRFVLSLPDLGLSLPGSIPASQATAIRRLPAGAAAIPESIPVITLDHRDDIHNLYSAEPLPAMHWGGPEDLGAVARLAFTGEALYLHVAVRDDVHYQTDVGENLWEGDSLQIGLSPGDGTPGYFEAGIALANDGRTGGWVFTLPGNGAGSLARGPLDPRVQREVVRSDRTTTYRLRLPWALLGLKGPPAGGFRFNFVINDNDGRGRKQWVKLDDGLGDQKNPALWRIFTCP